MLFVLSLLAWPSIPLLCPAKAQGYSDFGVAPPGRSLAFTMYKEMFMYKQSSHIFERAPTQLYPHCKHKGLQRAQAAAWLLSTLVVEGVRGRDAKGWEKVVSQATPRDHWGLRPLNGDAGAGVQGWSFSLRG